MKENGFVLFRDAVMHLFQTLTLIKPRFTNQA